MRSYYTYGAIPDPVRTVRGFDDGGLATVPSDSTWKGDVAAGQGILDFFNLQREREFGPGALQSFAGPTGGGTPVQPGQFSLYSPTERSAAEVAADYAKASGLDLAGFAKSQGMSEAELMSQINKTEMDPTTQRGALNEIKSLAGAGDFQGAFEAAKAAEARMPGQDFVSTLVSPESLRYITPEMDKKDVDNYFDALKNVVGEKEYEKRYVGTGNEMSLDQAKERSIQAIDQGAGFVNPSLGVKAEETLLSKLPVEQAVKVAAALAAAYTVAPGMFGAGSAGAAPTAGASTAGTTAAGTTAGTTAAGSTTGGGFVSGLKSAYQAVSGIPGTIGKTVAQTLGLPVNTALGQTALGNSIISAGTTAAKGGDIGDILKSGLMAAGLTYGVDAAVNAVKGVLPSVTKAVGDQVANAAASSGVPASTALDALQEVVVTGKRVGDLAGIAGAATGALSGAGSKSVAPQDLEEVQVTGRRIPGVAAPAGAITGALSQPTGGSGPSDVTPEDLEEVEVTGKRVPETPPVVTPATPPKSPLDVTPEDLEEVEVTGKRVPVTPPVVAPVIPPKSPLDVTPEDLEEVEVTGKRVPEEPPIVTPAPPTKSVPKTPEDLEEVEVTAKRPPPVIAPPVIITPPLTPPPAPKDILKDYKPTKIEDPNDPLNALKDPKLLAKLLGALGGAGAVAGGTTGGGGLAGKYDTSGGAGFGAGLTPVQFGRKQLSPDIDYYTYATRPEAKFFEYNTQLAQPVQPPLTPPPSEPSGVITEAAGGYIDENMTGGLIGYAKGGDAKPERYVDGPGSGREDLIPAMLSDGEYVIDAETLALLGDGSTKEGARRMDQFRAKIRQHKGRALSRGRISPNAKSPEKYMGGGLS